MPACRLLLFGLFFTALRAGADGCPGSDSEALAWLDKMSKNIQQVSYHGVATLQRGGEMKVLQLSHRVTDGDTSEYLVELTGQGARVERLTHPLTCIHPGQRLLSLGENVQKGDCEIADEYKFSVVPGERIAGRKAVRIDIKPRDMYRYGYIMHLDSETGLLLKSETIGHGLRVLEKFQFAQLSYEEIMPPVNEFGVVHRAQHPDNNSPASGSLVSRPWQVRWLPRGFTPTDAALGVSDRRTYTDGLAVFSVFLEDLDAEIRPGEGVVRQGGTTAYTRGRLLGREPVLITVVGEIPVNTARMVVDSVDWEQ